MYITFFAGSPWAKTVFFPRNCSTFLPRPAESRNNFTLKAGLLVFAFLGERRTLADTRRGADDSMVKNSMEPDPTDCSILHSPHRFLAPSHPLSPLEITRAKRSSGR